MELLLQGAKVPRSESSSYLAIGPINFSFVNATSLNRWSCASNILFL